MLGISSDIICLRLSIDPKTKPVRQKRRSYDAERYEAMKAEVEKLKNIGFVREIGKNIEVYVDDMLVKSKHADQHIANLFETFCINKKYRMRLNPNKCAFGMGSGKFLGFMISQRVIEANPEKIKAIIDMKKPVTSKDIQSLTGKVAPLTRFVFKAMDKCAPFFKTLKGSKKYITWIDECAEAFKNLKEYMSKVPLLSKPEVGDTLIVYLSVSASTVSYVLIRKDGNIERLVYYASNALQDAETQYSNIEKLALALVIALGKFDISYHPKPAEKGQVVVDFIAKFTYPIDISPTPEAVASLPPEARKVEPTLPVWTLYVDGSSNQQGYEAGLVLTTPDKVTMEYVFHFKVKASNNEAEYEAFLASLRLAKHLGVKQIDIFSDSQLVVNQFTNNFDAKDNSMAVYLAQTQLLLKHFNYQITQVPLVANSHAYALARLASVVEDKIRRKIHVELLAAPSTMAAKVCNIQQGDSWITPIYKFLAHGTLPNDKVQAKQIQYKSTRYLIIND
ncbi:uncharacterized protein LOC125476226 [Pyrus x bretschneideri]|uniref:uncharacterized protein LOC125476226 n=1 Tax=Pyrus x bretschneideri TaxID=225117 RepID=UPI00202DB924|nr:uncharacterized protein LOC125476226 [Pyrus x bretschneideri]